MKYCEVSRTSETRKLIQDADILIGAIALVEDLVLITNNTEHFKRIQGLKLENWLE